MEGAKDNDAHDAFILAMWLPFVLAPSKAKPELDGAFDLGEVGSVRAKNWTKTTY